MARQSLRNRIGALFDGNRIPGERELYTNVHIIVFT